jgi:hypothetical protein
MTINDLLKLPTRNVWLITKFSTKLIGKITECPLGKDWVRLEPFDDPEAIAKGNPAWIQSTNYPTNVLIEDIHIIMEHKEIDASKSSKSKNKEIK